MFSSKIVPKTCFLEKRLFGNIFLIFFLWAFVSKSTPREYLHNDIETKDSGCHILTLTDATYLNHGA